MSPSDNHDLTGQVILHYQVIERLGAGGMGVVYRAMDLKLRRTVALKFLLDPGGVSEELKQRFMREAMASSALEDTNIGTLHAVEETADGQLFLVMACYEGPTLSRKMAGGPIPQQEAIAIALQLLRGLDDAHRHGIVHRDIKPGNIIFNSQGVLKILDFGLAKLHGSADLTLPGSTVGTVAYMAPEQAMGAAVDQRADLWSAGVVLYQMITGRRLYEGPDLMSLMYAVTSPEPPVLHGLTPAMERILKRALEKAPDRRYQTARHMLQDLEAVAQGSAPMLPIDDALTLPLPHRSGWRASLRRRWWVALVGAGLVVVLGVSGVAAWHFARRERPVAEGTRIAVLPLVASSEQTGGGGSAQALADGLRVELIRSLTSLQSSNPNLLVVPSSQLAAQHVTDPSSARGSLGLGTVLTGSFRETGDQLHVVLSSVDTASSNVLRTEEIDGSTANLPGLEQAMLARSERMLGLKAASQAAANAAAGLAPEQTRLYLASLGYLERWDKPGNLDTAIQGFSSVANGSPKYALAYSGLANCYMHRYLDAHDGHALELADQNATKAATLDNGHAEIAVALGQVRTSQGKYAEAVQEFQKALTADPRSDGAYRGLARAYAAMGLPDKAEQQWNKAIEILPNSVDNYNQLAIFEMGRGDYAGAAANFRKATSLAPDNASILGNLGAALAYAGKLQESRVALQRSIQIAPGAPAWNNLGDLDLKQGHFADAAADYEKALEFNKTDYRIWSNMAAAYARTPGQKDKSKDAFLHAAQMAREALKANPNDPVTLSDLAMFVASEGEERQEPLVLIERALALAPEDTYVQLNAAETYESLGYRKNALDWIAKLVAAGYPVDEITESPVLADLVKDNRYIEIVKPKPAAAAR